MIGKSVAAVGYIYRLLKDLILLFTGRVSHIVKTWMLRSRFVHSASNIIGMNLSSDVIYGRRAINRTL